MAAERAKTTERATERATEKEESSKESSSKEYSDKEEAKKEYSDAVHAAATAKVAAERAEATGRTTEGSNRFSRFRRHHLPILAAGQRVWLRDRNTKRWDIPSVVRDVRPNLRSYVIQTQAGGVFLRNRCFVKPRVSGQADGGQEDQVDDQGGVEEGESQEDTGGSNFSNVSSLEEPIGTAGQERALKEQERAFREQEGRRAGGGVQGGTQAVEKAQSEPTGHSRPGAGERSYKQALCVTLIDVLFSKELHSPSIGTNTRPTGLGSNET